MADIQTIRAERNEDGNVEVELYSRKFDVTALVVDGVAEATLIGTKYRIEVKGEAPKVRKQKTQPKDQEEVES